MESERLGRVVKALANDDIFEATILLNETFPAEMRKDRDSDFAYTFQGLWERTKDGSKEDKAFRTVYATLPAHLKAI